ncbi:MAG: redoxin domain-containing protein [Chloroherpetonaceae bacterium]|nr:redoxin domain-containing protein [Chthonomonadaceae bacterium]MDW8208844.1 redoxin domain-containing protein [Chloroherpetonaceae bacterium]
MQALRVTRHTFRRSLLITIGVLWLVGGAVIGLLLWNNHRDAALTLNVGAVAPAFALQDQYGHAHRLEDYHGRPVVLAFLPDLQQTSIRQLRSMNAAMRQFDTLGVKVFAITPTDAGTARQIHDAEKLDFPILLDPHRQVARAYGALSSPDHMERVSYVIGQDGRILLPVTVVHTDTHGTQLVELTGCCLEEKPQAPSRLIGKPVADFRLPRVSDGQMETLYGNRKQRLTVLFVVSATCPCSGKYDARMRELARLYSPQGVRFVAINSSANEPPEEIATHARKAGWPYPVLKDADNRIADRLEARVTPEAFVMDAQGILRYHGRIDDSRDPAHVQSHDLRNALDLLLAGRLPSRPDVPAFGCAIYRARRNTDNAL